jgi:23S rRNA (guanosine2251-2'-O)-methyltransferase
MIEYYNIYGIHASLAALSNKERNIIKVSCTQETLQKYSAIKNFKYDVTTASNLEQLSKSSQHQGIVVKAAKITKTDLILPPHFSKLVILDQITDAQNFGAIIRSAAAFNFDAIIIPKDNSIEENATVAKVASGTLELIQIFCVINIAKAMEKLKNEGFWIVGLDGGSTNNLYNLPKFDKIVAIVGSEHKGIRPLIKKNCDLLAKIQINPRVESLNASNAAAIFFNEVNKIM